MSLDQKGKSSTSSHLAQVATELKNRSRKKFLSAGLSMAGMAVFFNRKKKEEKKSPMKFLTQDGKLVSLDITQLPMARKVASKIDVQNWIKK